jgi:hypothetical protein
VGIAVRMTDSAEGSRVGMPDMTDWIEESEARSSDIEATSEGELPESVVACGMGSASVKAARLRRIMLLKPILTWRLFLSVYSGEMSAAVGRLRSVGQGN